MTIEEDPHAGLGAYVLHALSPADDAAFENHLAGCDPCRREAARLLETTARLGDRARSVPVAAQARARTLRTVARTRQDRALHRSRAPGPRTVRLALAASLAASAALGALAVHQHVETDELRTQAVRAERQTHADGTAITEVLTASDAVVHTATLAGGTPAAVVVSRSEERAVFAAHGLPALTGGRVYELWYAAAAGDRRPAGLLTGGTASDSRVLEGPPADAVAVGITVEPPGGSPQPTTRPLGAVPLAA
ncbi:anti-sigma factor [Streptomyces asoensis]|uniref:anti-sigma factor n=1 Tax=Streptomyces asoensis TaxID=249586 RepID=UPI0033D1703F